MSNSPLVTYTNLTSHRTSPRNHAIDTITIHCVVGQVTAKQCCDYFVTTDRQASSNYVVGKDGSIGLSVNESDRAWTSSNAANDHRALTIETASDTTAPYAVTESAYNALIELCTDICRRNGKSRMLWIEDKNKALAYTPAADEMRMTVHRWFAATACPGDYLYAHMGDISEKVNKKLEDDNMTYYKNLEDVPSYYQTAVKKAVDKGALKGGDNGLNVSEDLCRTLTILDRLGKLD